MSQDKEATNHPPALTPLEEKQVDFYGDSITAALVEVELDQEAQVYVPIRPICEYLGLDWSSQRKRLSRDEVLSSEILSVVMMTTESGQGKGRRENICLPLDLLPGWLFGIDASRVKPELKDKIMRYRRECYRVLAQVFQAETQTMPFAYQAGAVREHAPNPVLVQLRDQALELAKLSSVQHDQALSMARLADEQIETEAKALEALDQAYYAHQRLNEAGVFITKMNDRLVEIEQVVKPGAPISAAQAASISQAVKALASFLTAKEPGKVHYQSIFGELYRRFGVYNYREIRQTDYAEVLDFLEDWRKAAGNAGS